MTVCSAPIEDVPCVAVIGNTLSSSVADQSSPVERDDQVVSVGAIGSAWADRATPQTRSSVSRGGQKRRIASSRGGFLARMRRSDANGAA